MDGNCVYENETDRLTQISVDDLTEMKWDLDERDLNNIEQAIVEANELVENIDYQLFLHQDYGKKQMKSFKISPDACVQMALQLAYYRLHGRLVATYESASLRIFYQGRTETIRSVTNESKQFIQAMDNNEIDVKEKEERKKKKKKKK